LDTKKLTIFLLLAAGAFGVFMLLNNKPKKDQPPKDDKQTTQETTDSATSESIVKPPSDKNTTASTTTEKKPDGSERPDKKDVVKPASNDNPATWKVAEGTPKIFMIGSVAPENYKNEDGYKFQLEIDPRGAAIRTAKLTDFFATVKDKQLYNKDPDNYSKTIAENPDKYEGHYAVVRPVIIKNKESLSYSTGGYKIKYGNYPALNFNTAAKNWRRIKDSKSDTQRSVTYELGYGYQTPDKWKKTFTLQKTFTVTKGSYSVDVSLKLINHLDKQIQLEIQQAGPTGVAREGYREDERALAFTLLDSEKIQPVLYGVGDELKDVEIGKKLWLGQSDSSDRPPVIWYGFVNKFFGSISYVKPLVDDQLNAASYNIEYLAKVTDAPEAASSKDIKRTWDTYMKISISIPPATNKISQKTIAMDVFIGPKDRQLFLDTPLYDKLQYRDTVASGGCGVMTSDYLRDGLMWLLTLFASKLFFGNYGLAIILLVLLVRIVLHPLTKKGQISMANMQKNMAKLQPKIAKLKEKYANDKQALSAETMKLYKEHGNPMTGMLGCLPMMLQMPIWIALFSGLNTSVNLRNAGLLPFWLTDLAVPDQLITWSNSIPLIGNSFNLLPILLCVAMFLQTKTNPSMSGGAATTPEQAKQQKMMKYMMPVMMLFFFYKTPSGLTLYIMASTTIGVIEQMVIRKHIRERDELQAASETVVEVSGGGMRGSRPKKPKGPGWQKR
jgi:YidC/Oxa1 family membrane protein insertase